MAQVLVLQAIQQGRLVALHFDMAHDEAPVHRARVLVQRHALVGTQKLPSRRETRSLRDEPVLQTRPDHEEPDSHQLHERQVFIG